MPPQTAATPQSTSATEPNTTCSNNNQPNSSTPTSNHIPAPSTSDNQSQTIDTCTNAPVEDQNTDIPTDHFAPVIYETLEPTVAQYSEPVQNDSFAIPPQESIAQIVPSNTLPNQQDYVPNTTPSDPIQDNTVHTVPVRDPYAVNQGQAEIGWANSTSNVLDWQSNTSYPPSLEDQELERQRQEHAARHEIEDHKEQEERERRKQELHAQKELEDRDRKERDDQAQRTSDAMFAAAATRRTYPDDTISQTMQQYFPNQGLSRQKYTIAAGDTLESIAVKQLHDSRLASLIHDINKHLIPYRIENGKKLLQMTPKTVIFLPSSPEIKHYKIRNIGRKTQPFDYDTVTANDTTSVNAQSQPPIDESAKVRRANIESFLGTLASTQKLDVRIKYLCRLGDTLQSIATHHPALHNQSLWKLLAQINNLSTLTNENGMPLAKLTRGTTINLPSLQEIDHFRRNSTAELPLGTHTTAQTTPHNGKSTPASVNSRQNATTPTTSRPQQAVISNTAPRAVLDSNQLQDRAVHNKLEQLSGYSRVVSCEPASGSSVGFTTLLEIKHGDTWYPVVLYEVNSDTMWRHIYKHSHQRQSSRIDLPPQPAKELAQNDIANNWLKYCQEFQGNQSSTTG